MIRAFDALYGSELARVPTEVKVAAVALQALFADRPSQTGLDEVLMDRKLALHLGRIGASPADIAEAGMRLDATSRFRPTIPDILAAVEAVRSGRDRRPLTTADLLPDEPFEAVKALPSGASVVKRMPEDPPIPDEPPTWLEDQIAKLRAEGI